ncbi:hypothetical protein [Novosphingobium sp. SG720]|uniref:hypothetical protein n=1 Tax=Novosphingobium sp. SG720 TaxID=2586998 RepID=UPI001444DCE3|nr:hypothetical protein [Novosphingobium sp. SG720]NKJ44829.1 hypothetical protein [Novosphingobium sp. SG720]
MFTADEIRDLPSVISGPRFATYLRATNNDVDHALALYQWNLEISAAFIVPLQVCEVAARNGVVEAIEKVHGPNWPWSNGFIRSLPVPKKAYHYNPQNNLRDVAARQPTTGKVVAELNFAFWEKVFTVGQDNRLWLPNGNFNASFPGVPNATPIPTARAAAFNALLTIRHFRNRIAHHEPIFGRNLAVDYALLHEVIGWRSSVAANWVDKIQGVTGLIASKP